MQLGFDFKGADHAPFQLKLKCSLHNGYCHVQGCENEPSGEVGFEYHDSLLSALQYGFLPCADCQPVLSGKQHPRWMKSIVESVQVQSQPELNQTDLLSNNVNPPEVEQWFVQAHGIGFQDYLRYLRLNKRFGFIRLDLEGQFNTAPDHGQSYIRINRVETPIGALFAAVSEDGLCLLEFTERRILEKQLLRLKKTKKKDVVSAFDPLFYQLQNQLDQYFSGCLFEFDLPLDLCGTDFQKKAWEALLNVPYGVTRSYQQQADILGSSSLVRAVAKANGDNPISVIVPCHRIIAKDGKLTGYGGGLWRKRFLLQLEQGALSK